MTDIKKDMYFQRKGEDFIIKILEVETPNRVRVEIVSKNGELFFNKDEDEKIRFTNLYILKNTFKKIYK